MGVRTGTDVWVYVWAQTYGCTYGHRHMGVRTGTDVRVYVLVYVRVYVQVYYRDRVSILGLPAHKVSMLTITRMGKDRCISVMLPHNSWCCIIVFYYIWSCISVYDIIMGHACTQVVKLL